MLFVEAYCSAKSNTLLIDSYVLSWWLSFRQVARELNVLIDVAIITVLVGIRHLECVGILLLRLLDGVLKYEDELMTKQSMSSINHTN